MSPTRTKSGGRSSGSAPFQKQSAMSPAGNPARMPSSSPSTAAKGGLLPPNESRGGLDPSNIEPAQGSDSLFPQTTGGVGQLDFTVDPTPDVLPSVPGTKKLCKTHNCATQATVPTMISPPPVQHTEAAQQLINSLKGHEKSMINYSADTEEHQLRALVAIVDHRLTTSAGVCVVTTGQSGGIKTVTCSLCPSSPSTQGSERRFDKKNPIRKFTVHFVHDHLQVPKPFHCFGCGQEFPFSQDRDRHEKAVHRLYRPKAFKALMKQSGVPSTPSVDEDETLSTSLAHEQSDARGLSSVSSGQVGRDVVPVPNYPQNGPSVPQSEEPIVRGGTQRSTSFFPYPHQPLRPVPAAGPSYVPVVSMDYRFTPLPQNVQPNQGDMWNTGPPHGAPRTQVANNGVPRFSQHPIQPPRFMERPQYPSQQHTISRSLPYLVPHPNYLNRQGFSSYGPGFAYYMPNTQVGVPNNTVGPYATPGPANTGRNSHTDQQN